MLTRFQVNEAAAAVEQVMGEKPRHWLGTRRHGVPADCRCLCAAVLRADYDASDKDIAEAMGLSYGSVTRMTGEVRGSLRLKALYKEIRKVLWGGTP